MLIYIPKILSCTRSTLPVIYTWNNKAWMTAHPFTMWVTENFKLTIGNYSEKKKNFLSKILLLINNPPGHTRAVYENIVSRPGVKLAYPALQGWFLTTEPPGKSLLFLTSELLFVCLLSSISFETKESGTHFSCSYIPIFTHTIFSVFTQELRWRCTMGLTLFSCLLA